MELAIFFFMLNSNSFNLYIKFLIFSGGHLNICCFVTSLSFQNIGGFAEDIVKSILLFFLNSSES